MREILCKHAKSRVLLCRRRRRRRRRRHSTVALPAAIRRPFRLLLISSSSSFFYVFLFVVYTRARECDSCTENILIHFGIIFFPMWSRSLFLCVSRPGAYSFAEYCLRKEKRKEWKTKNVCEKTIGFSHICMRREIAVFIFRSDCRTLEHLLLNIVYGTYE